MNKTQYSYRDTFKALQANKNIFIEKPLCLNMDELNKIKSYIEKQEKCPKVFVGFNRRFSEHAQKVKEHFINENPTYYDL